MLLLAACAPSEPIRIPGTDHGTSAPPGEVPLLSEALEARCPGVEPPPAAPGDDLVRVTVSGTDATCNDGTPPVLWIRAATDPAHAGDWVLQLDDGSYCEDHETCADRWCGESYDASKMSSAWAAPRVAAGGIRARGPENAFAGWNHALVHYCSSDFWMGTKADHVWDGDPPYRLHFRGHDVLLAVLDALEAGVVSDDGAESLPPLGEAATVLFAGSSAGGYGVAQHLGMLAERLPGVRVRGVLDSIFYPPAEVMTAPEVAAREVRFQEIWDGLVVPAYAGAVDASCAATRADEPWRCADLDVVLRTGTGPSAFHQDLFDPVLYPQWGEMGLSEARAAEVFSEGLALYGSIFPDAALHGSRCGHHTLLSSRERFQLLTVADDAGAPWSFHDELLAGLAGLPPVAVDTPAGGRTECP